MWKPLTGEPDAGEPHVRFGGRGGTIQCTVPTPISLLAINLMVTKLPFRI